MTIKRAIFPGSFDPMTNGHLDLIRRGADLFDELIIAVLNNPGKEPLFDVAERVALITSVATELDQTHCRITVDSFSGLTVEFARRVGATKILRGIRAVADYEYERQMALMNRRLAPEIDSVFLFAADQYSYVSSSLTKQVFMLGGNADDLVPPAVLKAMTSKLRK